MSPRFAALKAAREEGGSIEFWGNDSPKCPHCGADFDITANDAWDLYDENGPHEVDCPACEEAFQVSSSASWSFSTDDQEDEE